MHGGKQSTRRLAVAYHVHFRRQVFELVDHLEARPQVESEHHGVGDDLSGSPGPVDRAHPAGPHALQHHALPDAYPLFVQQLASAPYGLMASTMQVMPGI